MTFLIPTYMYNYGPFDPNCRRHRAHPCSRGNVVMDHPHGELSGLFDISGGQPWIGTARRRHLGPNRADQIQCPLFLNWLPEPCCDARRERKYCKNREEIWSRRIKMAGFSRDDVKVTVKGRQVLVEGEKKIATGETKGEYDTVRMTRDLQVPEEVDTTNLRVFHGTNGELVLVAKYEREGASETTANKEDDGQAKTGQSSNKPENDSKAAVYRGNQCDCYDETPSNDCLCSDSEESLAECACATTHEHEDDQDVSVTTNIRDDENETSISVRPASEKIQTIKNSDDAKMMNLKIGLSGFKPEEIQVKVEDERVIIHARHEDSTDEFNSYREVYRAFRLPADVDVTSLRSRLTEDGTLHLEASRSDIDASDSLIPITKD